MGQEKRFEPSAARIRKAQREGDVPVSRILPPALQITFCIPLIFFLLQQLLRQLAEEGKSFVTGEDFGTNFMLLSTANGFSVVWWFCLKSGCLIALCGIGAAAIVRGFRFSLAPMRLSWKPFDIGHGFRQLCGIQPEQAGSSSGIVSITGRFFQPAAVLVFLVLGALAAGQTFFSVPFAVQLSTDPGSFTSPAYAGPDAELQSGFDLPAAGTRLLWPVLFVCLIAGAADCALTRRKWRRRLMMDHSEMRQELQEQQGNPAVLGARRQLHREIALHDVIENVRNSDVVVISGAE